MSTKIYNGIKFTTSDIHELYELLNDFKKESTKLLLKQFNKLYPFYLKDIMISYYRENGNMDNKWNIIDIFKRSINNYFIANLKNEIQIYPHKKTNSIYGYFILDNESEKLLLNKDWVLDFHYQNQTDPPEDISYEEFDKRKYIWDDNFKYSIFDSGFTFKIIDIVEDIYFLTDEFFINNFNKFKEIIPRELKIKNILNDKNDKK